MRDKHYQVVVISDDTADVRELNTSRVKILLLSSLVIFSLLTGLYFTADFLTDVFYGKRLATLRNQNKQLVTRINDINNRISLLTDQMISVNRKDQALRTYADLPLIDEDIRKVGVGGVLNPEISSLNYLLPASNVTIAEVDFNLDAIERALNLELASLDEIYDSFKAKKDMLQHVPTIRPLLRGYITSGFGERNDPFTGNLKDHLGIDIVTKKGEPIFATADGVISDARMDSPSFGVTIQIDHGYGYQTRYAHLSKLLVRKHQKVMRGQKIGEVGSTGRSQSPHLHYEVIKNGVRKDPAQKYFYLSEQDFSRL